MSPSGPPITWKAEAGWVEGSGWRTARKTACLEPRDCQQEGHKEICRDFNFYE